VGRNETDRAAGQARINLFQADDDRIVEIAIQMRERDFGRDSCRKRILEPAFMYCRNLQVVQQKVVAHGVFGDGEILLPCTPCRLRLW